MRKRHVIAADILDCSVCTRSLAAGCLVLLAGTAAVRAQCATQWLPGQGVPGTDWPVYASAVWDPDGAGPASPRFVVGGRFSLAGSTPAAAVASYDPATGSWAPLGAGVDGYVNAVAVAPNGDVFVGGWFSTAGGVGANRIARWNGSAWAPLGSGVNNQVSALTVLPNGDLVAAGTFTTAGGIGATHIARWDGASWSPLGTGIAGTVSALAAMPNGDVVAGGVFFDIGGVSVNSIARWDGSSWSNLGAGVGGDPLVNQVLALTTMPNGDLVAGGTFATAGGMPASCVARWNGSTWTALGAGVSGGFAPSVSALTVLPSGDLLVGGDFAQAGGLAIPGIARWNGATWSGVGWSLGGVRTLAAVPSGDIVAGGVFDQLGAPPGKHVSHWNGSTWSRPGSGVGARVETLLTMSNGDLVAGGAFIDIDGVPANRIARWNGTTWSALGTGLNLPPYALAEMPNGDLVAAGDFNYAGGVNVAWIARWNGSSWSGLGSGAGMAWSMYALETMPNGDLVVAGRFNSLGGIVATNIARWNGTGWAALGTGLNTGVGVFALTTLANGDLIAGGGIPTAGSTVVNGVARWNGSTWSALGSGVGGVSLATVRALVTLPDGDLIAGGDFTTAGGVAANHIARWNGSSWSPLGSGVDDVVYALATLPNGDLVAAGDFTTAGGVVAERIARWNGSSWSPMGSLTGGWIGPQAALALALLPDGTLAAGGHFTVADGSPSAYLARLATTCPATAATVGAGCTGSGGPNVLAATSLPWTGSVYRATATGMPATALVVSVIGFTGLSLPLAAVLPQGVPGCDLLASPEILDVYLPTAGVVETQTAIANTPSLAGLLFRHQVVPLELDGAGAITALTSTNALELVVGTF